MSHVTRIGQGISPAVWDRDTRQDVTTWQQLAAGKLKAILAFILKGASAALVLSGILHARAQSPVIPPEVRSRRIQPLGSSAALAIDKTKIKLPIAAGELAKFDFRAKSPNGSEIDVANLVKTTGGDSTIDVPAKQCVYVRPKGVEVLDASSQKVYLSGIMLWRDDAAPGKESVASVYRTAVEFENKKLTWSAADSAYSTRLFVTVESAASPPAATPPSFSEEIIFSIDGADVTIEPNPLKLTGLGVRMQVKLRCGRHDAIPTVTAKSHYGDYSAGFVIAPSVSLDLSAGSSRILGRNYPFEKPLLRPRLAVTNAASSPSSSSSASAGAGSC